MDSSQRKDEENQKSQADKEIIPYYLLDDSKKLRESAFGSVHECIRMPSNERKTLFMLPSKPEKWFTKEATSAFQLKHENIIKIYNRVCVDGVKGVVTEWVEGKSLKEVILEKKISYSLKDIFLWNTQSFSALEYVIESFPGKENEHFRRYFNRIVCPQNMILNLNQDVLKICALGLFKRFPDPKFSDNTPKYSPYWAPEVRNGKYRYEESDVFLFGVILWECITQEKPEVLSRRKMENLELFERIRNADYPVNASSGFDVFLKKCTFDEPQDRFLVSTIRTILENMILANKRQNLDVLRKNALCLWDKEEFYYCNKLIDFNDPLRNNGYATIFDYSLLEKTLKVIGSGSFGIVCSSEYEGKTVAVKFQAAMKFYSFWQEFEVLTHLEHENIVQVIGQTEKDGVYGIVMEYIDGTSLDKIIHESPANYTLGDVLTWNYQAASALEYMHFRRFLHRDIKPQNMLIEKRWRTLKLIDLGGAKEIQNSLNFTEMGTELYIAPEIDNKNGYNEKCDVYSFTITFWECCTAQKPQRSPDYNYYRSKINKICSAMFVEFIELCSRSNPSDRKTMWVIAKWLGDMLRNRKAFTETNSTFRENHICVWNEQTNELYYFPRTEYDQRLQNDLTNAKALFPNIPFDKFKFKKDSEHEHKNKEIIEIDRHEIDRLQLMPNDRTKSFKIPKDAREKRLENEFVILSKLKHENIVKLVGYTHDIELNYFGILTEYLYNTLEREFYNGKYSTKDIIQWGLQIARGLEYMHSQNILHCDIKPANILVPLLKPIDECKICNFSLSRDLKYSHPKKAVGTDIYMAPEVRQHGLLTKKSDVYSWAVMFWELCRRKRVEQFDVLRNDYNYNSYKNNNRLLTLLDLKSIVLGRKRYGIENGSGTFNDFIQVCADAIPDMRCSMKDIISLLENMLENNLDSDYVPDFKNIEADKVVKDNICLWIQKERIGNITKKDFFYASAEFSHKFRNWNELELRKRFKEIKKLLESSVYIEDPATGIKQECSF